MISVKQAIVTAYFWIGATITTINTTLISLMLYPFLSQKKFARWMEMSMGYGMLMPMYLTNLWNIKVTDLRYNMDETRYIIVGNHASFIDTLLYVFIPVTKKVMVYKSFTKIPLFGWLCKWGGHVPVDEENKSTAIDRSVKSMADGSSFTLYPEGQRSLDPYSLMKFKTGAFRLAQSSNIPILPTVIKGTGVAMPIGGICNPANLELVIGNPIPVGEGEDGIKEAIEKTRQFIEKHLGDKINGEQEKFKKLD